MLSYPHDPKIICRGGFTEESVITLSVVLLGVTLTSHLDNWVLLIHSSGVSKIIV